MSLPAEPRESKLQQSATVFQMIVAGATLLGTTIGGIVMMSTRISLIEYKVETTRQTNEWVTTTNQRLTVVEEFAKTSAADRQNIHAQEAELLRQIQDNRERVARLEARYK